MIVELPPKSDVAVVVPPSVKGISQFPPFCVEAVTL
jgi:hypothetical protein